MTRKFDEFDQPLDEKADVVSPDVDDQESRGGAPDIEIIEEPESFIITANVPNISREDIRVDVSPRRVVISALVRSALDAFTGFFRREAHLPRFERTISLPSEVKPDLAEAHYNNGVLEVVLPKRVYGGIGVYRLPVE